MFDLEKLANEALEKFAKDNEVELETTTQVEADPVRDHYTDMVNDTAKHNAWAERLGVNRAKREMKHGNMGPHLTLIGTDMTRGPIGKAHNLASNLVYTGDLGEMKHIEDYVKGLAAGKRMHSQTIKVFDPNMKPLIIRDIPSKYDTEKVIK